MENVLLIVHLILALCLIGVVLLQRSEGGMGSMGGGGGGGGVMTGRAAATAMAKLTWIFAIAFICTSIALTILAAADAGSSSVVDRITDTGGDDAPAGDGALPAGEDLLPPSADGDAPLVPQAAD
ncbi:preprotein translocase subunit SecG [Vannielia litorea]|uniref:preprotein translocase subunit SecG n=1 Tax=Vannielia TaxID=2813041 RepID=UPI001C95E9D4|nr:preprotein translocase subunit SecG [Vannielia litorea]MBY6046428.1 preprotein translocase subunit SecG [Vannielia litorea]MBY6073841.1 preprotein translocase subunit SecG [Vannielia litorea]MBY6153664.1 preprotein translocase subunit SecG [Vannielia litorea]